MLLFIIFFCCVWRAGWNIKSCEVCKVGGASLLVSYLCCIALLTSKTCEIQKDRHRSNPSMNWELITGHFKMHFYVFFFFLSHFEALHFSRGMLFQTRASFMFETCTSSWSQQLLEGSCLFIRTRLPWESYMQMEINVGNDKRHLPYISHEAEQVPGQEGSGELNKEPWPPPSTLFIVLHSLPNHRSRYPKGASLTLNICPTLPL